MHPWSRGGFVLRWSWCLLAALLALALRFAGVLAPVERILHDRRVRSLPAEPATRVAAVLIDEASLARVGRWPWSRDQLARLVDAAFRAGARGVAVDLLLPEEAPGDADLAEALGRGPSVLAAGLDDRGRWLLPGRPLRGTALGHVSFDLDQDGIVRRFASTRQADGTALPALSVAAARLMDPGLPIPVGRVLKPGFRHRPVPSLGAAALLQGASGEALRGRIVFIGASAAGLGDRVVSPVSPGGTPEPGVLVEALAAEAILAGDLSRNAPFLADGVLAFALALGGALLLASPRGVVQAAASGLLLVPFGVSALAFRSFHLDQAPLAVAAALAATGGLAGLDGLRRARRAGREAGSRIRDLEALQERLAAARREEAEARRVVAHELRTPLTSVKGLAQLLAQFDLDPSERSRVAGMVMAETTRLSGMVEALLDLERLRLRDFGTDARALDLSSAFEARAALLQAGTGRRLDAAIERGLRIRGDQVLLERVLDNLVSNALKFSPEGTPVALGLRHEGGDALLEVSDHGPGIPQEERRSVFGRFARGSSKELAPGLGLGLALVSEVVAWHGGSVEAGSGAAGGARISVRIPLLPSTAGEGS